MTFWYVLLPLYWAVSSIAFWSSQKSFLKVTFAAIFRKTNNCLHLLNGHHYIFAFNNEQNNLVLTIFGDRISYYCFWRKWERKLFDVSFLDCSVILSVFFSSHLSECKSLKLYSCRFCRGSGKNMNIWRLSKIVTSIFMKSSALSGENSSLSKILVLGPWAIGAKS